MKRNLLTAIALMAFITGSAFADVTIEQTTDAEYLINAGYSQVMAEDVFIQKNRALGNPVEPLYEKNTTSVWKKFFTYLDPAQENLDRLHHDIQLSPSASDL